MRYFLKNIALFLGFPFVFLLLSVFILQQININALKVRGPISTVFVGDSHIQCGLDPASFDAASNIATNSEHYFFSYFKLKKFIELNPSVKEAFVGFSHHNISSYYDSHYDGKYADLSSSKSFFFLPRNYQIEYVTNTKKGVSTYYKSIIKRSYNAYQNKLYGFDNHFVNTQAIQNTMDKRIITQFYNEKELRSISESNMLYLGKIIELCRSNSIQLSFITTPVDPYYKKNIPKKFIDAYDMVRDTSSIRIIDFEGLALENTDFAPDGDHVALKATNALGQFIKDSSSTKY